MEMMMIIIIMTYTPFLSNFDCLDNKAIKSHVVWTFLLLFISYLIFTKLVSTFM